MRKTVKVHGAAEEVRQANDLAKWAYDASRDEITSLEVTPHASRPELCEIHIGALRLMVNRDDVRKAME